MAIEKKWEAIPPRLFTSNGGTEGQITLASTIDFKVKQKVILKANTLPGEQLEVKRVVSETLMWVGPIGNINLRSNLTAYTTALSATIEAIEQDRVNIPIQEHENAVFAEEPIVAKRSALVDRLGRYFHTLNPWPSMTIFRRNGVPLEVNEDTVDPSNNTPLPVKLTGVQGDITVEADNLNLNVQSEGEYDVVQNPKPDSIGIVSHGRGVTQDRTNQTERPTSKRGTTDTDTVSQDISIHDHNGNQFTSENSFPVESRGSRGTYTNRSGTATTSSSQIAAANASRKFFYIKNVSTGTIWIDFGTAAVVGIPSIPLEPGEEWFMKDNFISTEAIHVISQSSTRNYSAKEG